MELLFLGALGAGLYVTYRKVRDFVTERLRFVDAAQRRSAPWLAGAGAAVVTGILVSILPVVSGLALPALFGVTVGAAVKSGQKQVKLLNRG
jgi:hypothetical protein